MSPSLSSSLLPDVDEDNWHRVTDAKKRKKIQDKLAQRARRKRLREAKHNSTSIVVKDNTGTKDSHLRQACQHCGLFSGPDSNAASSDTFDMPDLTEVTSKSSSPSRISTDILVAGQGPDIGYEPYPSLTVVGALFINGTVLGLSCCTSVPQKSSPANSNVPQSLRPTLIQLVTLHQSGIDRFPFPRMRDNMITMDASIDEEEFTRDLCIMPSFTIRDGMVPWDPKAWKVQRYFAQKWGYLFQ